MAETVPIDHLALLADAMRAHGYPVRRITMRDDWMWREPDEYRDEGEIFWGGRSNNRKRGFTAPVFDWELEDGRRFFGKTRVHTKRVETNVLFVTSVRHREDHDAMLADLKAMIRESCDLAGARDTESKDGK